VTKFGAMQEGTDKHGHEQTLVRASADQFMDERRCAGMMHPPDALSRSAPDTDFLVFLLGALATVQYGQLV